MKTDLQYLKTICDGDEQIISEMIELFSVQVREIAVEMLKAEKVSDFDTLSNMAHKAKSSVAIMGMKILSDMLKNLESMAKEKINTETYRDQINFFIEESEAGIKELTELRKINI